MPGPDYYRQLFSSFRTVEEEEKKKKPFSFDDLLNDLSKYAIESPYYEETVKGAGKEPLYPGQPAEAWIPKNIAETFKQAIQLSDNPSEMENRLYSSYYVSQAKEIPFDEAFQNLDSILQHDYGEALSPKSGLEAVANAYKASILNQYIAKNYYSLKKKYLSGQYTTWDDAEKDPDYQSILTLEKQMPPQDYLKRSLPITILKATAQIIPSWTETLLKGATAGMLAKILTTVGAGMMQIPSPQTVIGGALVSVIPTIATLAGKLATGTAIAENSRVLEGGAAFRDMMEFQDPMTGQKINPHIAALAATAYEGLGTVVQMAMMGQFLGSFSSKLNEAQITALKDAILSTAKSVPDAAERSGLLLRIVNTTAGKFFLRYGETVGSQTLAAGLREGLQIWSTETAKQITNKLDGSSIAPKTLEEITSSLANTMATTAMSMAAMAIIPSAYSVWRESNINAKIAVHEAAKQATDEYFNNMKGKPAEGASAGGKPAESTQPKLLIAPGNQTTGETVSPAANPPGGSQPGGSQPGGSQPGGSILGKSSLVATHPGQIIDAKAIPVTGPEVFFKEMEPAPGIMEIRGTTQNIGETRKATIRGFFATDDENKIIRVSSIAPLGDIKKNSDEALRQTVDLLKHVKDTLPDYQLIFNPTTELLKKAKDAVLSENPDFFKKPPAPELEPLQEAQPEQITPQQTQPQAKETNEQNIIKPQQALEPQNIEKTIPLTPVESAPVQPSVQTPVNAISEIQPQETEKGKAIADAIKTIPPEATVTIQSALSPEYKFIHEDKFPVADIKFHPELPNFKEGANERGVVKGEELQGKPNYLGFPPIVLWQAKDGQYYIVTGRHRLDLWTRNNEPHISVDILREEDGYTTEDMAQLDAEMNIRDGQGKEKDYERYFRRIRGAYTYEDAEGRGLLRKTAGQNGFWIGTYASPSLESLYVNGEISGDKARAIAEIAKDDEDLQQAGIQIAQDKSLKADEIANALYFMRGAKRTEATQLLLDGVESNDPSILNTQIAIGKAATEIQKDIAKQLAIWRSSIKLSAEDRRKVIEAAGFSAGNVDKSAESIVDELAYKATQWAKSNWATNHDLVLQAKIKAGVATEEEQLEWELLNAEQTPANQPMAKQPEASSQVKVYTDEEQYMAEHGASKLDMGEPALHKNRGGKSDKEWKKIVDKEAKRSAEIMAKRDELRKEYQQKIASGEIREMSRVEKLIATANGSPDNEATQAARRLLEKKGIEWEKKEPPAEQEEALFEERGEYKPEEKHASPWIYKTEEVVEGKIQGPAPGRQILKTLQAAGVKADELKWTGLDDFLDTDEKKSPQEVLDFIRANKLQIQEVTKDADYKAEYEKAFKKALDKGYTKEEFTAVYYELLNLSYGDYWPHFSNYGELGRILRPVIKAKISKNPVKYGKYTLPGRNNYRELLITLPGDKYGKKTIDTTGQYEYYVDGEFRGRFYADSLEDAYRLWERNEANRHHALEIKPARPFEVNRMNYQSGHWSEANVLAHTRVDDRTLADGSSALFIEEIQSDWHQLGRKVGYKSVKPGATDEETKTNAVSDAPFQKTWHELVFKRLLKEAVEKGYDYIAWTTGVQQSDRYNLSQYVDSISWEQNGELKYIILKGLEGVSHQDLEISINNDTGMIRTMGIGAPDEWEGRHISDALGKDIAERILKEKRGKLSVYGLKVANSGMKGFYDKILVDFANKYGKKWGTKVEDTRLRTEEIVHAMRITDEMRGAVSEGQYLFEDKSKYEPVNKYVSPWKYKAAEVVQQKIKGSMPGKQVLNTLIANGVKQEELKWTGLDDFLDTDVKVSPQTVLDYIEANKLVIKEVIKEDESQRAKGTRANGSIDYGYDNTRYHSWTLPGGKNYREVLFTLPIDLSEYIERAANLSKEVALLKKTRKKYNEKLDELLTIREIIYAVGGVNDLEPYGVVNKNIKGIFRGPHWSEGNIVAHTRVDDRKTPDNAKVLFIEEIQSDWHQRGREYGYKEALAPQKIEITKVGDGLWNANVDGENSLWTGDSEEEVRQLVLKSYNNVNSSRSVHMAPFSKTWHEFVFKRMLKDAVEKGYDYLAWTTGKQQNERYNLGKYIDSIKYSKTGDGTYNVEFIKNKGVLKGLWEVKPETIQEYVGKDLTTKIVNGEGESEIVKSRFTPDSVEWKTISGADLNIGNKGMEGFYDKILVDFANKYGKKWGSQVQDIQVPIEIFQAATETVHALPITDQMRGAIPEGQYLFEGAKSKYGLEIPKQVYREQMLKSLDIMKLLATNMDNFFNKEIQDFISKNNTALIAALMNAKTNNIAFENPKVPNVKFTITPAADGSSSWDLNYYKDGEIVYAERYKSRTQAIVTVYTEAALPYGDVGDWQLNTTAKELYDETPNQIGDMIEAIKNEEPIEYDEKTLKIVYGSKEKYDEANKSLSIKTEGAAPAQPSLLDIDESQNGPSSLGGMDQGELFENGEAEYNPSNAHPRPVVHYRQAHISDLFGQAGTVRYPAYVENRKGQRRVSFVGQRIASAEDVATLFQVYRNPQIETFHIIYLDENGKILAHNAMSSGQPGFTLASESRDNGRFKYYLKDRMARLGAKNIILMHNHPSGNVTPSYQDSDIQARYENALGDAVLYHIILDHGEATVFKIAKKVEPQTAFAYRTYSITQNKIKFNLSGYTFDFNALPDIHSPKTAVEYAASILHNDNAKNVLLITDYQLRVISWRPISYTEPGKIYQAIRESGGSLGFVVTSSREFFDTISNNYEDAIRSGGKYVNLMDIIYSESSLFPSVDGEKIINGRVDDTRYKLERSSGKLTRSFLFQNDPLYLSKEAMEFDNYDDFKKAYQGEQGDEEELKSAWQAAQKEKASAISAEDFVGALKNNPEQFRAFLEANGADLFDKKVARKTMNVVDATSYRIATGGVVSDATMNRTLALIEKNASKWKARYDELMGNTEAKPSDFEITTNEPEENIDLLLAKYKEATAKLPENAQLSQLPEEISKNVKALREELQKNKNKLIEYQDRFSYAEKRLVDMEREIIDIDKKIFAERAKKKMGKANGDLLSDLETHKKELTEMVANRTKALSPESGLRNAAYLAAQKAVQETRQKLREQIAVQRAKKAQRELMLYYAKEIMRPPARNVDFKVALQIRGLQQQLDPHFRRISAENQNATIELPGKKPLNLWNIEDLKNLYQQISELRDYGAALYEEKMAERRAHQEAIRSEMTEIAIETGKERPAYMYGTDEFHAQQQADKSIFKNFDISLTTIHRITRKLDGGKEGLFYKTVVQADRDKYNLEKKEYDRRRTAFETKMQELGLDRDALYQKKVNLKNEHISKWEAIALYIGIQNPKTEAAIVFGNMMSIDDKAKLPDEEFYQKAADNRAAIRRAISTLTPQEIALAEWFIQEGRDNYQRLADATYEYENRIPVKEDAYYPHERKMRSGEEPTAEEIMDQVMARAAKAMVNVGKQPTIERITIGDRHQTPINLDAYQVYLRAWETQEHYIAYAPLITELNGIFKSRNAETLRDKIRRYHGQSYVDYIDRWISEAANPKAFKDFNATTQGIEKMFQALRGPLGVAYLGLRASRGVFQLITSPAPFYPYAGAYMVKQMIENLNPASFMKSLAFAKENSAFIRHRVINPVDAYIKEYIENEPSKPKRIAMEMMGAIMEWADMWSVSTGWLAVYNKTAAGLRESGKTAEEIHDIAYKEADKILQETQPTYRHEDLSPAFKMDSQLQRFLFQFQTPLNVIYNQLFHDAPNDWKNGHRGRSLGIWFGYMAVMGLIALITAPKDKDDDEEKKVKRFLSGMATAPLDTIPFVGNVASGFVESAITGDRFYRDDQIFPGVTKLFEGAYTTMTTQDEEARLRAYLKMLEASGMFVGVPTSALKEYSRVIFKGDWGALWGQREY